MGLSRLSRIVGVVLVLLAGSANVARAQQAQGNLQFTSISPTGLQLVGNVVTATGGTVTGTLADLPFTTQITRFILTLVVDDPTTPARECSVLDLELAPIDIDLLGLHVDTSAICLKITADPRGGLLGDLLCSLTGLNFGDLLDDLLNGLIPELNAALRRNPPGPGQGNRDICDGPCEILDLALGPLDLSLLGLNVHLDNCANGPVQICVSASQGEGILGDLLCPLAGGRLNLTLADIGILANRALQLLADGNLSRRDLAELQALLARLIR